ncbi:efflux RND transporter periplasmic adaptor subunit [Pseudoalteromonas umbrosa]|uniref:efflux RND transporter periplasmic adaptor subunit n=1 Tax=Pseudoalteromonas umbrosa TaxID=3048489 RepID=UPI0024C38959|nr:efflux RND transporter periplasmic adaptor subunit [Pseudoalteromonas sp. B95]MDK1287001.1 efflux RND transporter periplasmic adaptor subunit [Pseudoalteromonas sp. B95]
MDTIKSGKKTKPWKKLALPASVIVAIALLVVFDDGNTGVQVNKEQVVFAEVKRGNIDISVEGYGVLKSKKQSIVTSLTKVTMTELLLKPGATVSENSVIARFENRELELEYENKNNELKKEQSNVLQLQINNRRELLDEKDKYLELHYKYESARRYFNAQKKLNSISALKLADSEAEMKQYKSQLDGAAERLKQLEELHKVATRLQEQKVEFAQLQLQNIKEQRDNLSLRAGMSGILQKLFVELGQTVEAGGEIALVGSVEEMVAEIKIPQHQVEYLEVGQVTRIYNQKDSALGAIARIEPSVENNTVTVEVELNSELPKSFRIMSNIEASVMIETLSSVLYINKPTNVQQNAHASLFSLVEGGDSAQRVPVHFGKANRNVVQVLSGLNQGDIIIISDLTQVSQDTKKIQF